MNQMFHALQALENNALLQLTGIPPPGYTETSIAEIFAMRPAPNVYFYTRHADDAPSHFSRAFRDHMEPPTVLFFNVTSTGLGYWSPWNMTAFTTALAREAFHYGFGANGQIPQGNPVVAPAVNAPIAAFPAIAQIPMEFNAAVAQQVAPEALEMQTVDAAMDAAEDTPSADQEEVGIIAPIPMEFNAAVAQQVVSEALEMQMVDAAMDAAEDTASADQEEVEIIAPIQMEFNAAMAQQVAPETGRDIPEALEMKEVDVAMDAEEDTASADQEEVMIVAQDDAESDDAAPTEENLESEQGDKLTAVEQQLEGAGNLAQPAEEEPKEETEEEVLCAMEEQKKSHAEKMAKLIEKLGRVQQTTNSLPPSQLQGSSSQAPTSATPSSSTSEQGLPSFELDLDLFQSRSPSPAPADDEADSEDKHPDPESSTSPKLQMTTGPSPSASSSSLPPPVQKRKHGVQTGTKMRIEALLEHPDTKSAVGYLYGEPHVLYDDHDEERRGKDTQQVRPFEEVTAESFVTFAKRGGVDISAGEARERLALFQSVRRKQVNLRLIKSEKKPSSVAARTNRKSKTTRKRKNEDEDFVYAPTKIRKFPEPRRDDDEPGASGAGMVY